MGAAGASIFGSVGQANEQNGKMFARSTTMLGRSTKYDCREVRQSGRRHHRVCLCVSSARTSCCASSPSMTVHMVGRGLYASGERASSSSSASSAYFTCSRSASTSSSIHSSRRSTSFRTSACSDSKKHRNPNSTRLQEEPLPKAEDFLLVRGFFPPVALQSSHCTLNGDLPTTAWTVN